MENPYKTWKTKFRLNLPPSRCLIGFTMYYAPLIGNSSRALHVDCISILILLLLGMWAFYRWLQKGFLCNSIHLPRINLSLCNSLLSSIPVCLHCLVLLCRNSQFYRPQQNATWQEFHPPSKICKTGYCLCFQAGAVCLFFNASPTWSWFPCKVLNSQKLLSPPLILGFTQWCVTVKVAD